MAKMTCPNCGKKDVEFIVTLESNAECTCPDCGAKFDTDKLKRSIEEAIKRGRFNI